MDDTVTFTSACKKFEFTVKSEFFSKPGVSKDLPIYRLFQEYKLPEYFHNPNGPCMVNFETKHKEYFLNGYRCTPEEEKKIEHNLNFNNKFMDILNDGPSEK